MKKHNSFSSISLVIIGAAIISGTQAFGAGKGRHFVVKLKGNTLYASPRDKKAAINNMEEPVVVVAKKHKVVKPESSTITERPLLVVNRKHNVVQPVSKDAVAPETSSLKNQNVQEPTNNVYAGAFNFDYEQRQVNIHTSIFQLFPGTYLDSMSIVNQLLSDSIRGVITSMKNTDSIQYLKLCLENSMRDSITLAKLSTLSSPDQQVAYVPAGVLIAHCKDASSSGFMDSVVMDVFSGSNLVASATSDKDGIILAKNVPEGNYYVVFSRKSYEPYSLMRVNVAGAGQSYIDIPLIKSNGYVAQVLGKNAWVFIATGIVVTLFIMVILSFYLVRFTSKRTASSGHGHVNATPA